MSRRSIDTHFWNDSYIGSLDPDLKILFLYLITSPLSNMLGVYEIQLRRISFDTGLPLERVKEGLELLREKEKAEYVDGYIILSNFVKNQSYNTNMLKSALSEIEEIPDTVLKSPLFAIVAKALVRVNEGLGKGSVTLPNRVIPKIESEVEVEVEREEESESERGAPEERVNFTQINNCPVPEMFQYQEFYEQYKMYLRYMEENHQISPTPTTTENDIGQLVRLKNNGNDPVKVIQQTMGSRAKSFFELRENKFKSNTRTNGHVQKGTEKDRKRNSKYDESAV